MARRRAANAEALELEKARRREPRIVANRERAHVAVEHCAQLLRSLATDDVNDMVLRNVAKIVDAVSTMTFISTTTTHPRAPKRHIQRFAEDVFTDHEILTRLAKATNWAKPYVNANQNEYDTHQGIESLAFMAKYVLEREEVATQGELSLAQWQLRTLLTYFSHLPKVRAHKGTHGALILVLIERELARIAARVGTLSPEDAPLIAERMLVVAGMPAREAHQATTFLRKKRKRPSR